MKPNYLETKELTDLPACFKLSLAEAKEFAEYSTDHNIFSVVIQILANHINKLELDNKQLRREVKEIKSGFIRAEK